jgi:XrtN system VIT domain protein
VETTQLENKLYYQPPAWVVISRQIPKSALAERIIKSDLVYKTADLKGNLFWGDFHSSSFNEPLQHDPFIIMASLFSNKNNLSEKERINILKTMFNSRHKAQERLWPGDKLKTTNVITNIQIRPEYRLAYTEKTISIANTEKNSWRGAQEAIYTFHVPEGSVVTSLSLWINGKEEKAILTSKGKADSAYREIVGVESRDPSVVHWQEGNTVTVRIFPCTPEENRKFKIGITSPLKKNANKLTYQNSYFEGPEANSTTESVRIAFSKKPGRFSADGYDEVKNNVYEVDRDYIPYWEVSCAATPLSKDIFSFSGSGYKIKEYKKQFTSFDPITIYADINSSWSDEDLNKLKDIASTRPAYVFQDRLTKLTKDNFQQVTQLLIKQNFSLFPVYKIEDPEHALLISKSTEQSPNLADLEDSEFQKKLSSYFNKPVQLHFYNLGDELSPYLKALKEFRILVYDEGTFERLQHQLTDKQFLQNVEDEKNTVIGDSQMMIEEVKTNVIGSAPDQLMRLYAYNDIMKKAGSGYYNQDYLQPALIEEAETAYVVSPVSSLIVLETQKDYERFNITDSKNSLKNASMKSSGSVPEPQEWMLILMALIVAFYLYKKNYGKSLS